MPKMMDRLLSVLHRDVNDRLVAHATSTCVTLRGDAAGAR
jgi:hypothetical protein